MRFRGQPHRPAILSGHSLSTAWYPTLECQLIPSSLSTAAPGPYPTTWSTPTSVASINALAAGWRVLERGGSALDAVEEAVVIMEDDETFDAGRGSFLNRDGKVQLDALIMDGATLRAGGVGCVERLRNPVRAARKILSESPHVYFVGEGAEKFAAEHGIPLCDNKDLIIPREVERLRAYQAEQAAESKGSAPDGNDLFAPDSDEMITIRQFRTTRSARSRSTAMATSPPRRQQAER